VAGVYAAFGLLGKRAYQVQYDAATGRVGHEEEENGENTEKAREFCRDRRENRDGVFRVPCSMKEVQRSREVRSREELSTEYTLEFGSSLRSTPYSVR
jgi:hypothetical protein